MLVIARTLALRPNRVEASEFVCSRRPRHADRLPPRGRGDI